MKFKRLSLVVATLTLMLILSGLVVYADSEQELGGCTSLAVSPGATVDGSAMCTHTDDSGSDTFYVSIVREADWEPGTMRPVLNYTDRGPLYHVDKPIYQTGEIPQVAHTFAYTNTSYSFQNEMGVGMGESTIGGANECRNSNGMFEQTELMRVALERATTAREAIQIMGSLAEKYGYISSGEMRAVIDGNEAWVFEIYGPGALWTPDSGKPGTVWVAQKVPDGEIAVCANKSVIGAIDLKDTENFMASSNIYSLAEELGLWDPKSGIEFKVYDTYGKSSYGVANSRRVWRVFDLLTPSIKRSPWVWHYPFSVKPDKPVSAQDIIRITRDVLEGTEFDMTTGLAAGPFADPFRYAVRKGEGLPGSFGAERCLTKPWATWSTVVVARKDMPPWIGSLVWFAYDYALTACYMPIYAGTTVMPKSFATGRRGGGYDVLSRESAWWAFQVVANYAQRIWSYMFEDIKVVRDSLEADFFALQPTIEKAALELYEKDPALARTFITNYTNSCANRSVDAYWELASNLFGRYNDQSKYADNVYKTESIYYPDWWAKAVEFGKTTIIPEGYPWYTIDQEKAPVVK